MSGWAQRQAEEREEREAYRDALEERAPRLEEVARPGVEMRKRQKEYFKTRTREALIASKEAESAFDKAAAELEAEGSKS